MKRVLCGVAGATIIASRLVSGVFAQGGGQPPPPTGLAASLQRAYAGVKANVMQAADTMPAAAYTFKPNPDIRTFGGQLGHIANFHYLFCAGEKGVPNPYVGQDLEKKTAKADILKVLADSYAYCDAAFSSLTDQRALELVAQGRGQVARGDVMSNLIAHDNEEYGTITVYLP